MPRSCSGQVGRYCGWNALPRRVGAVVAGVPPANIKGIAAGTAASTGDVRMWNALSFQHAAASEDGSTRCLNDSRHSRITAAEAAESDAGAASGEVSGLLWE
jgi:hypothetical protein